VGSVVSSRTAGQKADATIVANVVRDQYSNPSKDAIRTWVTHELLAAEPTLVLDLWGGGRSADEMTAAGLSVLSVDDGRGFVDHGVTKMRARRALEIKAELGGYRSGWGSVAKFAPECDAAWLDFMGHLCGETVRVLEACRGMKAIAITLMPDRMAGVANLPVETWVVIYRTVIEHYTGLRVRHMPRKYKREGGLWVLVFLAKGALPEERVVGHTTRSNSAGRRAYMAAYLTDPEHRAKSRAYTAKWKARHPEHQGVAHARFKSRWATDPEFREASRAKRRARRDSPDGRAKEARNEAARAVRDADPVRRAQVNARRRELHAAKRAEAAS
jgi:hypothetical protein